MAPALARGMRARVALLPFLPVLFWACSAGPSDGYGDQRPATGDSAADGVCSTAGGALRYLDDACHAKRSPTNRDRDLACPAVASTASRVLEGGRVATWRSADELAAAHGPRVEDSLTGVVPPELAVTLVLIRRVDGVPRFRYLSNGTAEQPFQTWSSSKFLAVANAAAALRGASSDRLGLDARVGDLPLGDLVTIIDNYDARRFTSNSLARYFLDIGGRARAGELIHAWLGRPATETCGDNYGDPGPALGYTFVGPDGASITVAPDRTHGPRNLLSTRTLAEALLRLVVHREVAATRLPGIQWKDLRVLFHGADPSQLYPGQDGGMSADTAIYLQSALDMAEVEERSQGQWRIYSKLGHGEGDFWWSGYGCFPALDANGRPIPDAGQELVLSVRLASGGATMAERDARLAGYVRALVAGVLDDTI
jgi:hypothetical protein